MKHFRNNLSRSLSWAFGLTALLAPYEVVAENEAPEASAPIIVRSTPLQSTLDRATQQVAVLSGDSLREAASMTLGETLAGEPGISSSYFGPGASRPVIRGLGGDRVKILENGLASQDASAASPDHATTIEPLLADQIEVVRGPATLLYGASAIGGAVNVVDSRVPEQLSETVNGVVELRSGTVDEERTGLFRIGGSLGKIAVEASGLARKTDDVRIPGFARTEQARNESELAFPEPKGKISYSATETQNGTVGVSYIDGEDFVGTSLNLFTSEYGVPNGEEDISIDADRIRSDISARLINAVEGVDVMSLKLGYVDYEHTEYEGEEEGTVFKNDGFDARYEIRHSPIGRFKGVLGLQLQGSEFEALGEEAYQPPTDTNVSSTFLFEEYTLNDRWTLQAGGRLDYQEVQAQALGRNFASWSQSAGVLHTLNAEYTLALSLAHTERAPTGQELFSEGPHVATAAYEIGDFTLDHERSIGADLSVRKTKGDVTGLISGFYNRFPNFIALLPTGELDEEDEFEIFRYEGIPVDQFGFESQLKYHFYTMGQNEISVDLQPDYVWTRDRDTGDSLPRMPPFRVRAGFNYDIASIVDARIEVQHVLRQSRIAESETETPGYTFLNASLTKPMVFGDQDVELFLRGSNLLNDKARESTSFLKEVAPLPGADVIAGIRVWF